MSSLSQVHWRKRAQLVWLLCGLAVAQAAYAKTVAEIARDASPSVVLIATYDITGDQSGQGSGLLITTEGLILTNAHVMKGAYSAEVITDSSYYDVVTLRALDETLDLALIQVAARRQKALELALDHEVVPGDRVVAIGNPMGLERSVSDGLVSAVRTLPDSTQVIQTTAPISAGSSGGPLLNMEGHVVGITTATIYEGQNLNFAVSVKAVPSLIDHLDEARVLHVAGSRVWVRWLLDRVLLVVVGLIAALFSGVGGVVLLILIFALYPLYWIVRGLVRLISRPFRHPRSQSDAYSDYEADYNAEGVGEGSETSSSSLVPAPVLDHLKPQEEPADEDEEVISFFCWKCGQGLEADWWRAGEEAKCPSCGTLLRIPDGEEADEV